MRLITDYVVLTGVGVINVEMDLIFVGAELACKVVSRHRLTHCPEGG